MPPRSAEEEPLTSSARLVHKPGSFDLFAGNRLAFDVRDPDMQHDGSTFWLSFETRSGWEYHFEYKDELSDEAWSLVETVAGDGTDRTLGDEAGERDRRFYRVRAVQE